MRNGHETSHKNHHIRPRAHITFIQTFYSEYGSLWRRWHRRLGRLLSILLRALSFLVAFSIYIPFILRAPRSYVCAFTIEPDSAYNYRLMMMMMMSRARQILAFFSLTKGADTPKSKAFLYAGAKLIPNPRTHTVLSLCAREKVSHTCCERQSPSHIIIDKWRQKLNLSQARFMRAALPQLP